MKRFLATVVLLIIALAVMLGALAMAIYVHVTTPRPLEAYNYASSVDTITAIDIAEVSDTNGDTATLTRTQSVTDIDAFIADFEKLQCSSGINPASNLLSGLPKGLRAIKFTYADGTEEIITAIGNLDSSLLSSDFSPEMILSKEWCFFDEEEFNALLDKYLDEK